MERGKRKRLGKNRSSQAPMGDPPKSVLIPSDRCRLLPCPPFVAVADEALFLKSQELATADLPIYSPSTHSTEILECLFYATTYSWWLCWITTHPAAGPPQPYVVWIYKHEVLFVQTLFACGLFHTLITESSDINGRNKIITIFKPYRETFQKRQKLNELCSSYMSLYRRTFIIRHQ